MNRLFERTEDSLSLLTEVLVVSGVALDLVGAGVLSHAHNAESIAEIKEEIGEEGKALGEDDAIGTHAQLLAEKRVGFFILTVGLIMYLTGLVLKSPEGVGPMAAVAAVVVVVGLVITVVWTKITGNNVRRKAREAEKRGDTGDLPEH